MGVTSLRNIPHQRGAVGTPGNQALPIRRESDRPNRVPMSRDRTLADFPEAGDIPQSHRMVRAARGQYLAVGREGRGHIAGLFRENMDLPPGGDVPEAERTDIATDRG